VKPQQGIYVIFVAVPDNGGRSGIVVPLNIQVMNLAGERWW